MFAIRQEGCPYRGLPNIAQPQVRVSPCRLLRINNIVVPEQLVVGKTDRCCRQLSDSVSFDMGIVRGGE